MNLIALLYDKPPALTPEMSAIEKCEAMGEIDVDVMFGVTNMSVTIGQWEKSTLRLWGSGGNINQAAEATVAKMKQFGLIQETVAK